MRIITLFKTLLLTAILTSPLLAEESETLSKCEQTYEICTETCEQTEQASDSCYEKCDAKYEACIKNEEQES